MPDPTTNDRRFEIRRLNSGLAYIFDRRYDRQMHHAHAFVRCLDWIAGYNQAKPERKDGR